MKVIIYDPELFCSRLKTINNLVHTALSPSPFLVIKIKFEIDHPMYFGSISSTVSVYLGIYST